MRRLTGKDGSREWTEYVLNSRRNIIVQRAKVGLPWYIFDSMRGPKAPIKTVGYDMSRAKAEEKALVYIKGLNR